MRRTVLPAFILIVCACGPVSVTAVAAPAAKPAFDVLPKRVQDQLLDLVRTCSRAGGRAGDPMQAIEAVDLDGDGTPDLILNEDRFPCRDVGKGAVCPQIGCSTYLTLSDKGRWRPALDFIGGYCLDRKAMPPQFLTIQQNFSTSGLYTLNVRYRFRNGMAFQEGRGTC